MLHATITAMALLWAAQAGARAGVEVEKASEAKPEWLRPTRVRLDFRDQTLAEIVDGINAQGPAMLAIGSESRGGFQAPFTKPETPPGLYSLREPGPVTFWEAIDRVGRATGTWPMSGNAPTGKLGILLLPAVDRGFACNDGAFRVMLMGLHYSSNFQFAPHFYHQPGFEQPRPDGSSRRPTQAANLTIMAEPRLQILSPVELVVREAVDDQDRSLIPQVPWRQPLKTSMNGSYRNQEFIAVPLMRLEDPGERIKRLAGSISVKVFDTKGRTPAATVEMQFDFREVPLP
jgi:hypothetical protein